MIDFEGVDASGKSETAQLLAQRLNAVFYQTPAKSRAIERQQVDATATAEEHYRYYLKDLFEVAAKISIDLAVGRIVVCDRFKLTTKVYHRVMGVLVKDTDFAGLLSPDVIVYLTVDEDVQAKRFLIRGLSSGDRRMINKQTDLASGYEAALIEEKSTIIRIDTSRLNKTEVVEMILANLR